VGLDPLENFAVGFSGSQLGQKGFEIEAEEPHEVLVGRRVVVIFAVFPGEGGAAFVQNAGQEDEAAKAGTHAPRRALG